MSLKLAFTAFVAFATVSVSLLSPAAAESSTKTLQDKLNTLMILAPKQGERSVFQEYVNYYYRQGTSFDPEVERDVNYLSIIGVEDINGEFFPQVISTVTESWRKSEDGWDVTQLIREVTLDGRVVKTISQLLMLADGGRVKDVVATPAPDAAADQAAFATEIDGWYAQVLK